MRRAMMLVGTTALVVMMTAGGAHAGEITGNGKLLEVHGASACSFSGQEDLQWYTTDDDTVLRDDPTRGDPAHAQSWGQIPKDVRDFLATIGLHPGMACNPTVGEPEG